MLAKLERNNSLVEEVVSRLRREIDEGRFAPNTRLPPELLLAEQLEVSRPVVREAIARLKVDNIIVTRKGSGAFVSENPVGNAYRIEPLASNLVNLQHVFELRYWVECAAAELAATRRTEADLEAIERAVHAMEKSAENYAARGADDATFHRAIAKATHNPYFSNFVDFLGRQLAEALKLAWENSAKFGIGAKPAQDEHRVILAAIRTGDPEAARNAAHSHLYGAAERLRLNLPSLAR